MLSINHYRETLAYKKKASDPIHLSSKNVNSLSKLELNRDSFIRTVSFCGSNYDENSEEAKLLFNRFLQNKFEKTDEYTRHSIGANGVLYKLTSYKDPANPLSIAVKMAHSPDEKADLMRRMNVDYSDEARFLKMIPESLTHSCKLIGEAKDKDGKVYAIALTFVSGQVIDARKVEIKPHHLKTMLDDLFELDKAGILHRDLLTLNLLVTDDYINILDYGAAKTFEEMTELNNKGTNLKYLFPQNITLSNIDGFESMSLLVYLRQLSNFENGKEKADKLFLTYLKQKADFHSKKAELVQRNGSDLEIVNNEKARAKVFSRINDNKNDSFTKDVRDVELLRMKMENAQRKARIYLQDGMAINPVTSMYWTSLFGYYGKAQQMQTGSLLKKYSNDEDMQTYLNVENEIATFYTEKVFMNVIQDTYDTLMKPFKTDQSEIVNNVLNDGNWLSITDKDNNYRSPCYPLYKPGPVINDEY